MIQKKYFLCFKIINILNNFTVHVCLKSNFHLEESVHSLKNVLSFAVTKKCAYMIATWSSLEYLEL